MKRTGKLPANARAREAAIQILAIAASCEPARSLYQVGEALLGSQSTGPVALAYTAVSASLEAGNWREQRAEAAQKLREGWCPPGSDR